MLETYRQAGVPLDLISESVEARDGRVVHQADDAALAEFVSVVRLGDPSVLRVTRAGINDCGPREIQPLVRGVCSGDSLNGLVARGRIEPPTRGFSIGTARIDFSVFKTVS